MEKHFATALFSAAYCLSFFVVAELHAENIIRDAVIGPPIVAVIYAVLFLPSALAAIAALRRMRLSSEVARRGAAIVFAAVTGAAVHAFFLAGASSSLGPAVRRGDVGVVTLVTMNSFLIVLFVLTGSFLSRRAGTQTRPGIDT